MEKKDFLYQLAGLIQNSKPVTTSELLEEMVQYRIRKCFDQCQAKKVVCILRPMCPEDRAFLDILLVIYPKHKLPLFCYSQRLKELNRGYKQIKDKSPGNYLGLILPDKPYFHPNSSIYVEDLPTVLEFRDKKPKNLVNTLEAQELNFEVISETRILLALKGQFAIINLKSNLCTFYPIHQKLNPRILEAAIKLLSNECGLKVELRWEEGNTAILYFRDLDFDEEQVRSLIRSSSYLMAYGENYLIAEIPMGDEESFLGPREAFYLPTFEKLLRLYKEILEVKVVIKSAS
ncbi:MAG: hypothetical protein ACFFBD_20220 [Candidatus Hodarchaeota archaeon]